MKRFLNIFILISICAFILSGCSSKEEVFEKEEYTTSLSDIGELEFILKDYPIDIVVNDSDVIKITYFKSDKNYFEVKKDDNTLSMKTKTDKEIEDYFGLSKKSSQPITIEIPKSIQCDLTLETSNNDIVLPNVEINGNVNIDVNNGDIILEKIMAKKEMTLFAKSGNILGTIQGNYDEYEINSDAKKGKSNLPENKSGKDKVLNASTNNGDIEIEFE